MDEATASMDNETDKSIQRLLASEFTECTLLTIAHRISTVLDYNRVLMMSKGSVVEYDSPSNLLGNTHSLFRQQYDASNEKL